MDQYAWPVPVEEQPGSGTARPPGVDSLPVKKTPYTRLDVLVMLLLAALAFGAGVWIALNVTQRLPHLEDEMAYIFQARVFARGALSAPPPPDTRAFFMPFVLVVNGNWVGKYPVGWPLVLGIGEALGAWSVPDVNVQHYHNVEYLNGRLYVLRRIGYTGEPDDDWSDELWRYDRAGAGEQLSSVRGLDFRVAPTEAWIAVRYDERHLTVFDPEERVEPAFSADVVSLAEGHIPTPEMGGWVTLVGWSADGESLWLASTSGPQLVGLLRLTAGEWQVDGYDVSGLPAYWEWDLQPTTGRLAYSDMPMLYDSIAAEEFAASGRPVTLYVLDLDTGQSDEVATSEARRFGPRWVDEETLEYYDPADTSDDPARITVVVPDVPAEARAILVRTTPRW